MKALFISTLAIIILFNGFVILVEPSTVSVLTYDYESLVITCISLLVPLSITFLGTGLKESVINIIFGVIILFNVLYRIDLYGYSVGMGLMTTITDYFSRDNEIGLGWMIANGLSVVTFVSGMVSLTGGGE